MRKPKKIIIIIQRSNGDVFLSSSLINALYGHYENPQIDLIVNDDTYSIAKLIPFIQNIYTFSYHLKQKSRWKQEKNLISKIYKKYDLSINLTASDRSIFYALMAGKKSISAVEKSSRKSWWKKIFLTHYYYFDMSRHILINNLEPLNLLNINFDNIQTHIEVSSEANLNVNKKLEAFNVSDFVIFHPSTQYNYKIYPQNLRDILLSDLSKLGVSILITGGNSAIDIGIKKQLPLLPLSLIHISEPTRPY